jgi:hypothetical protein
MGKVLGLDISTSCTGLSIVHGTSSSDVDLLEFVEFKKCKTLWEKVDHIEEYIASRDFLVKCVGLTDVYVEESLQMFRPGLSSASTISTLSKFNAMVSLLVRQRLGITPQYIAATSARKRCGIRVQKIPGKTGKQQAFDWATSGPLSNVTWPLKKNGKNKDGAMDAVDAYVIATSGWLIESIK